MTTNLLAATALAASAAAFTAGAAHAQDVTVNVGVTSDYVFRGYSQSDEGPAVFGGVEATHGSFYAGVWASTVDFGDGTDGEVDVYAGWRSSLGDISVDLSLNYYGFLGMPSGVDYSALELKAAASVPVGPGALGVAAYWSPTAPDYTNSDSALYLEINGEVPVADSFTLSGAFGEQAYEDDVMGGISYTTWNAGMTWAATDAIGVDLRYHDTDEKGVSLADERVVLTLTYGF